MNFDRFWKPLTMRRNPFVLRYFVCPRFDRRHPTYRVQISFTKNKFTRPWSLHPFWPSHLLASYWCNITEWAQSTYPSLGWTYHVLIYFILLNMSTSEYPRYSFMVTTFQCNGDVIQSILIDNNSIWSSRYKDEATMLLSHRNAELCDWITSQCFRWVCVHHIIILMIWPHCQ